MTYEITFKSVLRVKADKPSEAVEIAYAIVLKNPNVVSPFPTEIKVIADEN